MAWLFSQDLLKGSRGGLACRNVVWLYLVDGVFVSTLPHHPLDKVVHVRLLFAPRGLRGDRHSHRNDSGHAYRSRSGHVHSHGHGHGHGPKCGHQLGHRHWRINTPTHWHANTDKDEPTLSVDFEDIWSINYLPSSSSFNAIVWQHCFQCLHCARVLIPVSLHAVSISVQKPKFLSPLRRWYFVPLQLQFTPPVSDSHPFHADPNPDPAQNINANPNPSPKYQCECKSESGFSPKYQSGFESRVPVLCGFESRPIYYKGLVILSMNILTFINLLLYKDTSRKQGKIPYVTLCKNEDSESWSTQVSKADLHRTRCPIFCGFEHEHEHEQKHEHKHKHDLYKTNKIWKHICAAQIAAQEISRNATEFCRFPWPPTFHNSTNFGQFRLAYWIYGGIKKS